MKTTATFLLLLFLPLFEVARGFTAVPSQRCRRNDNELLSIMMRSQQGEEDNNNVAAASSNQRRNVLLTIASSSTMLLNPATALAVERAVGIGEKTCQEEGNCLETLNLDAAVGWQWGAKDRCDATDPTCRAGGKEGETVAAAAVPTAVSSKITHLVQLTISIGREETGTLRFGLYGDDAPTSVAQLLAFLSDRGLETDSGINAPGGSISQPVSLQNGAGICTGITPGQRVSFGIVSQAASYAKVLGKSKVGSDFVPQPRPAKLTEDSVRPPNVAGLVTIPKDGIGYGSGGSDDEAFGNAFQITTTASSSAAKTSSNIVIGQVYDDASMSFLQRLGNLPTNKGLKGVIPGQDSGPPLLKVYVRNVEIKQQEVSSTSSSSE